MEGNDFISSISAGAYTAAIASTPPRSNSRVCGQLLAPADSGIVAGTKSGIADGALEMAEFDDRTGFNTLVAEAVSDAENRRGIRERKLYLALSEELATANAQPRAKLYVSGMLQLHDVERNEVVRT